jgi:DNA-binding XRE family transcriptional regulator
MARTAPVRARGFAPDRQPCSLAGIKAERIEGASTSSWSLLPIADSINTSRLSRPPRSKAGKNGVDVARSLDQILANLPAKRREKIEKRARELATLKDLRRAVQRTQEELAASLGVGQDTVSRIERRSDLLLSTLRRYIEAMGGKLELVAHFPNRPPLVIEQIAEETAGSLKARPPGKRYRSSGRRAPIGQSR